MIFSAIMYIVVLLAVVLGMFIYTGELGTALGVGALFVIIWVVLSVYNRKIKNEEWIGQIVDIRHEEDYDDEGGIVNSRDVAHLNLNNGKKKKLDRQQGWQVGDTIQKVKGEMFYRKVQ
ncbi:hypothetical protein [Methanosalsum natronophilum]|nr:hypothetical protein [Methanosalsum natronophilum]MCS3923415.1 hypothetical protein [Methanosalsum natronophilum]